MIPAATGRGRSQSVGAAPDRKLQTPDGVFFEFMLDIQFIKDNLPAVQAAIKNKQIEVDLDRLLVLDDRRRALIGQVDQLRHQRRQLAGGQLTAGDQARARALKDQISQLQSELKQVQADWSQLLYLVPNLPSDDTPVGSGEADNRILKQVGQIPRFDFEPKAHWDMANFVDEARAVRICGQRFTFLKADFVWLQLAVWHFCLDVVTDSKILGRIIADNQLKTTDKPFLPMAPPTMLKTEAYRMTGRLQPAGNSFRLADDDLWLTGSAEHSLCAYYQGETLTEDQLPVRLVGSNTAYRREVGSAGRDTRGIIRQHQFDKLEMESFSRPDQALAEHQLMIAIQEYLMTRLEQPFRTVLKCSADIGGPNVRGVDIETWMTGQQVYRETHSADYLGDFQARGLATFYQPADGSPRQLVHTNDATVMCQRPLAAILENNQLADGRVKLPAVLKPYLKGREYLG